MRQIARGLGLLLFSMVAVATGVEAEEELSAALRQVVENNLAAYNSKDVAGTMRSIHTKSPDYPAMQLALPGQFSDLDIRTELANFQYIGHDDEFAVARVKLKTVGQPGKPFAGNVIDTIAVFYPEEGEWKYWSNLVLGVELVQ
ncbi:MAG: hypothetical protein U9R74_03660 [Pseudomonadota bacterium]|nr:hypothetical protein [Pseudomonadota bacterium]